MASLKLANVRLSTMGAAAFAALVAAVACSDSTSTAHLPEQAASAEQSGELALSLQLASGDSVTSVAYTITGPSGFTKTGAIDVSGSSAVAATIASLPAGSGFSITLSAVSSNGQAQCSGSASFGVTAHQTTSVAVPLLCHVAARTGSVTVNGVINVCPTLDGINASPAEVVVGSSIALSLLAHDSDAGPAALAFNWTASSGSLSDAHSATPQFTCTSAGPATLTVSASDGDPASACADTGSFTVTCTGATGSGGASGASSTGGAGGAVSGVGGAPSAGGAPAAGGAGAAGAGASGAGAGGGGASSAGASSAGASSAGASSAGGAGGAAGTNLVIYRVGDGAGALANTGNAVFVDEYTTAGALVRSTGLPTTTSGGSHRLVASGVATSEGFITRSSNGKYILLSGYDSSIPASASLAGTTSTAVPRTIGRLDASGTLDTTTGLTDAATGNNPRSVASSDGVSLWLTGGAGGIRYATLSGSSSVQLSTTVVNLRQVGIFNEQLFVSDSSGSAVRLGAVGVGLPTTSGQTITTLPGLPTSTGSPYGFFLADVDAGTPGLDVAYVADDGIGILKYSLVAGAWTANGTLGSAADAYRGLTGVVSGSSVTLYSTRKGGSTATGGGELVQLVDASGFNGSLAGTPSLLASAAANTAFRGVALAPQP